MYRTDKRGYSSWPQTVAVVLKKGRSLRIIFLTIGIFFLIAVFGDDLDFLMRIIRGNLPMSILTDSLKEFFIDFFITTPLTSLILLLSVSLIAGIQLALFIHLVRYSGSFLKGGLFGWSLGLGTFFLALGCVACNSFFLSVFFTIGGITFALSALPLLGAEFYILSIVIFLISMGWTIRSLRFVGIC